MDIKTIVGGRLVCKAWLGLIDGRGADLAIWKRKVALEFPHLMVCVSFFDPSCQQTTFLISRIYKYTIDSKP